MTSNPISAIELSQRLSKTTVFSSRQMNWNGILVEQCQSSDSAFEMELPALTDRWFNLHLGQPAHLIQKRDDLRHESIIRKGDSIFVPAGQPSY